MAEKDVAVNFSLSELVDRVRRGGSLLSVMALKDLNLDVEIDDHVCTVKDLNIILDGAVNVSVEKHDPDAAGDMDD